MIGIVGSMLGGLGLFFVGMWLLTENLKTLTSRRLRNVAAQWTGNRIAGFGWGALAGAVTQSMPALAFVLVSMIKAGLLSLRRAIPIVVGANVGVTALVFVMTLDIELFTLFLLGIASLVMVSERAAKFRPLAASLFGMAMMFLGLVMIKDGAAPLAGYPWFQEMMSWGGGSLLYFFAAGIVLTFVVQSPVAVCLFGISMTMVDLLTVDQTIMFIYGIFAGAALIVVALGTNLTGSSRQLVMFQASYNLVRCAIFVPLLYIELYFGIPLVKAVVLSVDADLDQQMAFVLVLLTVPPGLMMLAVVEPFARWCERRWPVSEVEEMSRTRYIHDRAFGNVEISIGLIELEQRRVLEMFSRYLDTVRRGERLDDLRQSARSVLARIDEFLADLGAAHPTQGVEGRNSMHSRQKLITWLEECLADLCMTLGSLPAESPLGNLRSSLVEGVDAVFLALLDALETGDEAFHSYVKQVTGDRSELMRTLRRVYLDAEKGLGDADQQAIVTITNTAEQAFFLLSKLAQECIEARTSPSPGVAEGAVAG